MSSTELTGQIQKTLQQVADQPKVDVHLDKGGLVNLEKNVRLQHYFLLSDVQVNGQQIIPQLVIPKELTDQQFERHIPMQAVKGDEWGKKALSLSPAQNIEIVLTIWAQMKAIAEQTGYVLLDRTMENVLIETVDNPQQVPRVWQVDYEALYNTRTKEVLCDLDPALEEKAATFKKEGSEVRRFGLDEFLENSSTDYLLEVCDDYLQVPNEETNLIYRQFYESLKKAIFVRIRQAETDKENVLTFLEKQLRIASSLSA